MSSSITRLRIDDEEFLIASLIERCPKIMMLRELVQNAIEAAVRAPAGRRHVDMMAVRIGGTRKLAIRNTGPGMTAEELFRMCDLAASLGKQKGLDQNFGMGAKVAALPANKLGLRYRSCKFGRVHEVVIGKRDGVYGRIRRNDPLSPQPVDVVDVTGAALAEGRPLDHDWTEVILLGDRADQDTVAAPFDNEPAMPARWVATGLYHRFYRLPDDVVLRLHADVQADPQADRGTVDLLPIAARREAFARGETVALDDGTRIHYLLDPPDPASGGRNRSETGALTPGDSTAAIIFRDEMYDVRSGWKWSQIAPRFGLAFGVQHISVHVELPADAPVLPDAYRQFIRHVGGDQAPLEITDYAAAVSRHRPAWLLEALRALGPDTRIAASLREELADLMRGLGIRLKPRRLGAGAEFGEAALATTMAAPDLTWHNEARRNEHPVELSGEEPTHETPPDIILLRDLRHVHDRLLDGRAACYDETSNELYVNMRYGAFQRMAEALVIELPGANADPDALRVACVDAAEETMIRRIGRTLVHGLAKRDAIHGWNRWHLAAALSPEALTIAADDFLWSMPDARRHAILALDEAAPQLAEPLP